MKTTIKPTGHPILNKVAVRLIDESEKTRQNELIEQEHYLRNATLDAFNTRKSIPKMNRKLAQLSRIAIRFRITPLEQWVTA